jgi:2-phospho-L-lactate/phosphoenolpyruvate guanylyltransferase
LPDTPLVTVAALTRAVHTLGPVVVAPARDEAGTNLLLRRPPTSIASSFGRDSYRKHLEAAAQADVPIAVVEHAELAFDLDLPDDILTVVNSRRAGRSRQVLRELDLAGRLSATAQEG